MFLPAERLATEVSRAELGRDLALRLS